MIFIKAFIVGGLMCVIGQILIDKTKLTPARILVSYVIAGVVLQVLGLYQKLDHLSARVARGMLNFIPSVTFS